MIGKEWSQQFNQSRWSQALENRWFDFDEQGDGRMLIEPHYHFLQGGQIKVGAAKGRKLTEIGIRRPNILQLAKSIETIVVQYYRNQIACKLNIAFGKACAMIGGERKGGERVFNGPVLIAAMGN